MKEKIISAFKLKFPGVNLSKSRLAAIATKIEAKIIDDETKIDATLAAMDDAYSFADIAKDDDKIRTLEAKAKGKDSGETPAEKAAREAQEAAAASAAGDDTPAWAKALIDANKALSADLALIKGEKAANVIRGKLEKDLLKDVPASYWGKRAIPDTEDALEAFATEVTADYTQFKQELTDQGLGLISGPRAGGSAGGSKPGVVSPEIKAFVEKQNAAAAKQPTEQKAILS